MKIDAHTKSVLNEIDHIAKLFGISIFAVGGFVRDLVMNRKSHDVDLASADYGSLKLAGFLASQFQVPLKFHHRMGAAFFNYKDIDFDFQAFKPNFDVLTELRKLNVPQNHLFLNIYTRDFTINTLVYSIRSNTMYDPTKKGIQDIYKGVIRTPLPPDIMVPYNPIIILRALMFKNRFGFEIEDRLQEAIHMNLDLLRKAVPEKRFGYAIEGILEPDKGRGMSILKEFGIDRVSPKPLKDYLL